MPSDELTCLIALHSVPGMGQRALQRLVERFGTAERAISDATESVLAELPSLSVETARGVLAVRHRLPWAERAASQFAGRGGRLLRIGQPDYPARLTSLTNPPRWLYSLGQPSCLRAPCVAIVGSTQPSEKGSQLAGEFAGRLARHGVTIVSGMAEGIDSAGHAGAVRADGATAFVLPTGILKFSPGGRLPPAPELLAKSVALSECPADQEWTKEAAVTRNRIIAALASAVIVVETTPDGGAMHTFKAAQDLSVPLFAVRYSKPPPSASGNEAAIARGAEPLSRLADIQIVLAALR